MKNLLKISRPRFWLYLAGTYLVGYTLATGSIFHYNTTFWIYFLYFLIPANIYLYGINDYYDWDTDHINPKKKTKEHLLQNKQKTTLLTTLFAIKILSLTLLVFLPVKAMITMAVFLLLSTFYSAPPLRFKSKPILDFSSNILYGLPGIIGYIQAGKTPEPLIILAIFFWTASMHLYSAIPDIKPDKQARINTTAVKLGYNKSLIICTMMWLATSIITFQYSTILGLISAIYPLLAILTFYNDINKMYWYYPYINAALGFIIYLYAII
jgi:lycopene elongase/hydratase (dihydrobisanhydrobacterioruberin-forming)